MKKHLAILLTAALLLCAAPLTGFTAIALPMMDFSSLFPTAKAVEIVASGNCGEVNEEKGLDGSQVSWTLGSDCLLTISGSGEMANYSPSKSPWPKNWSIETVVIQNGVTSIGDFAFGSCWGLTSVMIPASVTSIGESAFARCGKLTSVTIPAGVTSIKNQAFSQCGNLTDLNVDANNLVYFSAGNCIVEKETKTLIAGCNNSVIPSDGSVTSIGNYAFYSCGELTSVTIPSGVTSIGDYAFYFCRKFTSVTIPSGVTSIGKQAFYHCEGLTSVTIPDSMTNIQTEAFDSCRSLKSINLPDGITSIGRRAFQHCSSLTEVKIPSSVTTIEMSLFEGCSNLSNVTIPAGITVIESRAFSKCKNLSSVTIPNGVTTIEMSAFENCTNLSNITIPDSVTTIEKSAFDGTAWFKNQPAGILYIGKIAYTYVGEMPVNTVLSIKDGTEVIADSAFEGCENLIGITIPNSVAKLGVQSFADCKQLKTVKLSEGTKNIAERAFAGCEALTEIVIPEGVVAIDDGAFSYCSNLKEITFPESLIFVADSTGKRLDAFHETAWMNEQPDGVLYAGNVAYGCKEGHVPETISFKEGTRSISGIWYDVPSVATIPKSVSFLVGVILNSDEVFYLGSEEEFNNIALLECNRSSYPSGLPYQANQTLKEYLDNGSRNPRYSTEGDLQLDNWKYDENWDQYLATTTIHFLNQSDDPVYFALGDVTGDGKVTPEDARLALRASVSLEQYEPGSAEFLAADANHDNKIGSDDARLILRASVGLETLA